MKSQSRSGSSRSISATSRYTAGVTVTLACPNTSSTARMSSPSCARRRSPRSAGDRRRADPGTPLLPDVFPADLLLQLHDAVEQRLGPGWAAGDVDVHRHDLVDALGHRIGAPVRPA